jgi:DNA-binding MarR family transcriptional regulator
MRLKFKVFPREQSPGYVIYSVASEMKAGLKRAFEAKGFSVTPEQWGVLSSLWEMEGVQQTLLAQRTDKDRHNITRILNLLERDGLVRRDPCLEDRRCQRVYLTEKGKALRPKLVPIVTGFLRNALAGLTQEDFDQMIRILGKISKNLAGASDSGRGAPRKGGQTNAHKNRIH